MLQTNRVLQKEQAELFAIQKKLDRVLPVIQEALNSLKVEELHLKSQLVGQQNPKTQCSPGRDPLHIDLSVEQSPITTVMESQLVNSQQIDLDLVSQMRHYEEEVDSD
ncbi:uncharacterized protein LOC117143184 [Drosophila mauritiana]|uniref:Uncharacterized protein LOC117143184 n=1 Tax=Drosophila mauritiana TaxID=7226 RepID=A0A6P8K4C7_DROMA|nr:uncharacterized protein LOC117143184 [Drosophila mauritiana]